MPSTPHGLKVAVITGAAQGIGRRTAELFATAGYSLALLDIKPCPPLPSADSLILTGDLTDELFVSSSIAATHQRFGRMNVLVNNAGISNIAPAETIDAATFRRVLEVNLVSPFLLSRDAGAIMLRQRQGSIVNIASIAALFGIADRSAYNASKHGLIGLTRTLAAEWGGRGVRVNAVCPGWVKTEMDVADQAGGRLST